MCRRSGLFILLVAVAGCSREPKLSNEVVALPSAALPASPDDSAWNNALEYRAKMLPQDLVEPRLLAASTPDVAVRALTDGNSLALRLEWVDSAKDDAPGPSKMVDACAIQIPDKAAKDPPDPQMGQDGRTVQVTYWRADWQASVNGRGDTIRDLYPNAAVDHYPFDAKASDDAKAMALRYAPARALGNVRSGPRETPVEDLIATGPGTLKPGPSLGAKGKGNYQGDRWRVVISRKLPEGLAVNERTHIAFAVWQGSQQESGARKMRTGWAPLVRRGAK